MIAKNCTAGHSGARVLVLEDDVLNALFMEDTLRHAGFTVVGPARSIRQATRLLADEPIDAAILDLQIENEQSFMIGQMLQGMDVPWAFVTGHTHDPLPEEFLQVPLLAKPFDVASLIRLTKALLTMPAEDHRSQQ